MKIALLGYGKMGKTIEAIAVAGGHQIVFIKSHNESFDGLDTADVAIDFSVPTAAADNIRACLDRNVAVVSGTTGWLHDYESVAEHCRLQNGAFLYASNFSLGVNIFFEVNAHLARIMSRFSQYKIGIEEIHHTQKLDAPSGTAITLANTIITNSDYNAWTLEPPTAHEIRIDAQRIENVPGTHVVQYDSDVDSIAIKHTAHNRDGFAKGAVLAAEWLQGRNGIYTMKDVLGL